MITHVVSHPNHPTQFPSARPVPGPDFFVGLMVATPLGLALWAAIVWSIWWLSR